MEKIRKGMNPFLPSKEYIPDGEPHVFGDRIYLFGSHDRFDGTGYCQDPYVCWSASVDRLTDWLCEGVILEKGQDPLDPDGDKSYYAPDVVQGPDGRFYLYYSIENSGIISVAVCDTPAGKYKFYGHVKAADGHVLGSNEEDPFQFDPAVLADQGKIYLYSGQNMPVLGFDSGRNVGALVCELEDDMLNAKTNQKIITSAKENLFEENPFFEASSIRKYGEKYYFIYSPLPNVHALCYAMSDFPDRDFRYQGVLVSNADLCGDDMEVMNYFGNNHGSLVQIRDNYYIFYHRHTNKSGWCRQACAEPIERNSDGTFTQARQTSSGLYVNGLSAKGEFGCYTACHMKGKNIHTFVPFQFTEFTEEDPYFTQEQETQQQYIANFRDGALADYRYFDFDGAEQSISITCRSTGDGVLEITGIEDGKKYAKIPVNSTRGWEEFHAQWNGEAGHYGIRIQYRGAGYIDLLKFQIG